MPVYRGLLRNERVQIWRRTMSDDGMCGRYPNFGTEPLFARYVCRLFFNEEEKFRDDTGEERTGAWTMFGMPYIDIREGDKVIRSSGQEFIITSLRKPYDGRVEHHLKAVLRKIDGVSSTH